MKTKIKSNITCLGFLFLMALLSTNSLFGNTDSLIVGIINDDVKAALKQEIDKINLMLANNEIKVEEAKKLKKKAAVQLVKESMKTGSKIANQDSTLFRKDSIVLDTSKFLNYRIISTTTFRENDKGEMYKYKYTEDEYWNKIKISKSRDKANHEVKSTYLYTTFGLNNIMTNGSLYKTDIKVASIFGEIGIETEHKFKKHPNTRFKWGIALTTNNFELYGNNNFVNNGDDITVEPYSINLKKSNFSITNLILPVHYEFIPSRKAIPKSKLYETPIFGIGGFAGILLDSKQFYQYRDENNKMNKLHVHKGLDVSQWSYGICNYIKWRGLNYYARFHLNSLFKNQSNRQNVISLGLKGEFR